VSLEELTAVLRMLAYALTLTGVIAWSRRRTGQYDWLGIAICVSGVFIAGFAGFSGEDDLTGVLRMPVTILVCAYVLLKQPGAPQVRRRP
jgi:drug/metabolite transporter (DMT)-like permease